ncbi:MAG: two-component sensor histidine kinase, partial [Pseudomonadota bacterium]
MFLLIAGLGTWSAYQFGYERFEKSALVTSAERLSLYQATLRSTLARVSHLPRVMVMHPHTRDLINGTTDIEAYNKYLESVSDSAGSAALYILDADGTTIAASNYATDESFVGNNYRFRKYYSDAIKTGKADFFAVGVTTGRPGYFLS